MRHARFIGELITHEGNHLLDVSANVVGATRPRDPEELSHPLTERNMRAGPEEIVLRLRARAIAGKKFLERQRGPRTLLLPVATD